MKKTIAVVMIFFMAFSLIIQGCTVLAAQNFVQNAINDDLVSKALNWYTILQVVLSIGFTYASPWLPFLNRISNKAVQGAIVAGLCGFIFYYSNGEASAAIVAFLTVVNPYELIAKPILGKTPTVTESEIEAPDAKEVN